MIEKVITVGLRKQGQSVYQFEQFLHELRRLVETARGEVVKEYHQTRSHPDPATLVGKGKLEEIAKEILNLGVKTVVFDDNLTAAQQKNIEKIVPAKIVDRTRLILDIFASRARTREGRLQVELAQLNYMVPRLTGSWRGFSQQMGGIGTRGPGERKIEVERLYVRERIRRLNKEINEVREHRNRVRSNRQSVPLPQVALVGYTNVGKSTLLNKLIGEDQAIYADDKLFATLDPTTRRVKLPGGQWVLFTDTVGFIQKLPPYLVAAFRATLEEVSQANLLIHILDASDPDKKDQYETVLNIIKDLKADHIPSITVYNKIDKLDPQQIQNFTRDGYHLISSRTGDGFHDFLGSVEKKLDESLIDVSFDLPYSKRELLAQIYRTGHIITEKPSDSGTFMRIRIDPNNWKQISHRLNQSNSI